MGTATADVGALEQQAGDEQLKGAEGEGIPADPEPEDPRNRQLEERLQKLLKRLCTEVSKRDIWARMWEIRDARLQRLYWRGIQNVGWSQDDLEYYLVSAQGKGAAISETNAANQPHSQLVFNLYQGYGKTIQAVFCQNQALLRFKAKEARNPRDTRAALEARKMQRAVESYNPPTVLQAEIARLLWTDGRVIAVTDYVEDGERFGYEEENYPDEAPEGVEEEQPKKTPNGQEVIEVGGKLEWKVPMSQKHFHDWGFAQEQREFDITKMKADYPHVADKLQAGAGPNAGSPEELYARNARMAAAEGTPSLIQSGEGFEHLVTRERTWFRPSFYTALQKDDADALRTKFPDGVCVTFIGETYCESKNCSMNDHLAVVHAIDGDGQDRPSLGANEVPVNEAFNEITNLELESYEYVVPVTWTKPGIIDLDALQEQENAPGQHYEIASDPNQQMPIADYFYSEPPAQIPPSMPVFRENLQGPLSQFLTNAQPALIGAEMDNNKTASTYAMAREQAMGVMGLVWKPFKVFWATVILQAVRAAAHNRTKNFSATVSVPGKPDETEVIDIDVENLKGNLLCEPATDENFPESWTQKSNRYMALLDKSTQNPALGQVLLHPDNLQMGKDLIGLEDLVIPGADSAAKQQQEIEELLDSEPIPDEKAMQAQAAAQTVAAQGGVQMPAPAEPPMTASVPIDEEFDDHPSEYAECKRWINSPEGQKKKNSDDPSDVAGFQNVRMHALLHKAVMDKQQQQQAQQAALAMAAKAGGSAATQGATA
jgi:hypothetical protein